MPLFAVWRDMDHTMTAGDREAQGVRTIATLGLLPGVHWLWSFVIDEPTRWQSMCLYSGPDLEQVTFGSTYCQLPFREIRPVVEVFPASYGLAEQADAPADTPLFLVRRTIDTAGTEEELEALTFRSAGCLSAFPGLRWEQSFWDAERKESACLYRAPSAALLNDHAALARISCNTIEQVVEVHPRDWSGLYDTYGVAKYWETDAG